MTHSISSSIPLHGREGKTISHIRHKILQETNMNLEIHKSEARLNNPQSMCAWNTYHYEPCSGSFTTMHMKYYHTTKLVKLQRLIIYFVI